MNINISTIKQEAREKLLGRWTFHTPFSLLLLMAEAACALIVSSFSGASLAASLYALGVSAILQLLMGLVNAGVLLHFLKTVRGKQSSMSDVAVPLKQHPDRFLIVGLVTLAVGVLVYLPLELIDYVFRANAGAAIAAEVIWTLAGAVLYLYITAGWALSVFLLLDDQNLGAIESLRKSRGMMKGLRESYVKLIVSFVGYGLLSAVSLGVGLVWLIPYVFMARAGFYERVRESVTGGGETGGRSF